MLHCPYIQIHVQCVFYVFSYILCIVCRVYITVYHGPLAGDPDPPYLNQSTIYIIIQVIEFLPVYQLLPSNMKEEYSDPVSQVHLSILIWMNYNITNREIFKGNSQKRRQTCSLRETAMSLMILQNDEVNSYVQKSFKHVWHSFLNYFKWWCAFVMYTFKNVLILDFFYVTVLPYYYEGHIYNYILYALWPS